MSECQPRLDGRVAYAEPGNGRNSLDEVLARMGPGATIVLLPGRHDLHPQRTNRAGITDVWLVGSGADTTVLAMEVEGAVRLRIDNVAIDCQNTPAIDLRESGSVMLRGCKFYNYNSGAGGSEAIYAQSSVLLIESCEFEGKSGRAGPSRRGNALDLRVDCCAFIRGTHFVDNEEIVRDLNGAIDGCVVASSGKGQGDSRFWAAQRGPVFERGTDYQVPLESPPPASKPFVEALDDLGPLQRLAAGEGLKAWTDPVARAEARKIRIDKDPELWVRLLMSSSPEVRAIASGQVKLPELSLPIPLDQALMGLDQRARAGVWRCRFSVRAWRRGRGLSKPGMRDSTGEGQCRGVAATAGYTAVTAGPSAGSGAWAQVNPRGQQVTPVSTCSLLIQRIRWVGGVSLIEAHHEP